MPAGRPPRREAAVYLAKRQWQLTRILFGCIVRQGEGMEIMSCSSFQDITQVHQRQPDGRDFVANVSHGACAHVTR